MKDKTINIPAACLGSLGTIVIIFLALNYLTTGTFISKINPMFVYFVPIFFILFVVLVFMCLKSEKQKQVSVLRSVEVNEIVSDEEISDLNLSTYSSVLDKLSNDEWKKICIKYNELKKQQTKQAQTEQEEMRNLEVELKIKDILQKVEK